MESDAHNFALLLHYGGRRMKQIYVIKNIVNDKVYVGQAASAYDRFRRHRNNRVSTDKQSVQIVEAMKEIGADNFYFEILEVCDDSMADERERFYVKEFDSYKNGYNNTPGGVGVHYVTDEDIQLCKEMLLSGMAIKDIEEKTLIGHAIIKRELEKIMPDYRKIVNKNLKADRVRTAKTPVDQYDLNGQYIRSFANIREALLHLGLDPKTGSIANCCKHRENYNSAYGYKWEFAKSMAERGV